MSIGVIERVIAALENERACAIAEIRDCRTRIKFAETVHKERKEKRKIKEWEAAVDLMTYVLNLIEKIRREEEQG